MKLNSLPTLLSVTLAVALTSACGVTETNDDPTGPLDDTREPLLRLLPDDARGIFVVNLETLRAGTSADSVNELLEGRGDPALAELFVMIRALAPAGVVERLKTVVLVQTTDAADGLLLLAAVEADTIGWLATGSGLTPSESTVDRATYIGSKGRLVSVLPEGVVVVGTPRAVDSVNDVFDGVGPANASPINGYLTGLHTQRPVRFAYGLRAMFDDGFTADRSLKSAQALTGSLEFVGADVSGTARFHTANAEAFVVAYNELNRHATANESPETPLKFEEAGADGYAQIVVTIPPSPILKSADELLPSRNLLKKLTVGMEAHDYAEGVGDGGNRPWIDLIVKSEADSDDPPSPGSVFIRWEFKDQAAREAFEKDELPAGFTLAPCQFFESDSDDGEYFVALNLYNSGGGSIVSGARAEWDVFVSPPAGADPNAGVRPRFMVIDALAESISADPVHLITPAEPLSHAFVGNQVVTTVKKIDADGELAVFQSAFMKPNPDEAAVARFTREMAIGNDYIYWGHGVYDRVLYNASTFNHDAYFADLNQFTFTDDSRWAQYLKPTVKDVVYYVNTLEYVASPMQNLGSAFLDITPAWLDELLSFKNNGHQTAIMRKAVEDLFKGVSDALTGVQIGNSAFATYYHFEITDPAAMSATIGLPSGYTLAEIPLLNGGVPTHYLTLAVYQVQDAVEGMRAEWTVYADDGNDRPQTVVIDLMTADVALDPVSLLNLPSRVIHAMDGGNLTTSLASTTTTFDGSFALAGTTEERLALDWVEAGDIVCHRNGICDKWYYDAETLDVAVKRPATVSIETMTTPWDSYIDTTPAVVFYRDNPRELAVKSWHNLRLIVEEQTVAGLADRTHSISGSGTLVGRTTGVVDSTYTYSGDAKIAGNELTFVIDQEINNLLGEAHIITSGSFDVATGVGTQTLLDCLGPALMCSGIEKGSTTYYATQDLTISDASNVAWTQDFVLDLGGSFGLADSESSLTATPL